MADNAIVNPVKDLAPDAVDAVRRLKERSIRGMPIGPAHARYGCWPLSMLDRAGFRISHTTSAEETRRGSIM